MALAYEQMETPLRRRKDPPRWRDAGASRVRRDMGRDSARWPVLLSLLLHGVALYWVTRDVSAIHMPAMEVQTISVSMVASESPEPVQAAQAPPAPTPPKQKAQPVMRDASPDAAASVAPSSDAASASPSVPSAPALAPQAAPGPVVSDPRFDAAYLKNPQPVYPNMSRRLRETGMVRLRVLVGTQGEPLSVAVAQSSGFQRLDDAALSAVRRWRFQPAMRGDVPVEAPVIVPLEFSLTGLD